MPRTELNSTSIRSIRQRERSKSPEERRNPTSPQVGHVRGRFDRLGKTEVGEPEKWPNSTSPQIVRFRVRFDRFGETEIEGPRKKAKNQRIPKSARVEEVSIASEKRWSMNPNTGLNSASPQIDHGGGRFNRFGKRRDRRCPKKGSAVRRLKSAVFGAFLSGGGGGSS